MNRTAIIVSPYFPPSKLAGVHRARHVAKHLPAAGWTPVVLCVDEAYHEEQLDAGLAELVPPSVEVVKVAAISQRICRPLGVGEISLRAWNPMRRALLYLLATRPVGAVLITGSPYYPMLLAGEIKQRFGAPVVLDFQDPWVSTWAAGQPRWSKAGISHRLALMLEPKAVRAANFITSVSEIQNAEMAARYPELDPTRMAAIPIGADPEDYDVLRKRGNPPDGAVDLNARNVHLSYVGTIWPPVLETVRTLLRSVRALRTTHPAVYSKLRLNFVGTDAHPHSTPYAKPRYQVTPLAEKEGVLDIVREYPSRVPFLEALSIQARSHAILVLGSTEPHYTASKIFSILMSGRPFLSVFHQASNANEILRRAGGGIALSFGGVAGLPAIEGRVAEAIVRIVTTPETLGLASPEAYAPYTGAAIARQYAGIFDRVSGQLNIAA